MQAARAAGAHTCRRARRDELRTHLLPGAVYRVVLLNEEMRPVREIWEEELAESIGDPALSFDKEEGEGYNQKYQQRMTQEG